MKSKLKICMLGHKRIPSREGGVEIVVEELATRMAQKGHAVVCYNRKGHHVGGSEYDGEKLSEYRGVKLRAVPTIDKKGLAAMTSSLSASIAAAFGPYDIVHYHAEGPCAMMWIPKLFGKRCVATVHGLDWQREKWKNGFGSRYIKFGEKMAVKWADEIIVLSENARRYFESEYGRKTVYIPNGVTRPVKIEASEITRRYGLSGDDYILFLGRLVPEKGLACLIDAFKKVETDKKLVIAGAGSDTDDFVRKLKECAAEDERIIFTGFVQGNLLKELYSNSLIYVLPSDVEGMPLSLLEAMSYGNCCIVSDIAECTDVVEDKAVVFRKGDAEDLKNKLQTLCGDERLIKKYKNTAADFICEKYNWDDIVEQTLSIYQ